MVNDKYLALRGKTYYFRMRIPHDVRSAFKKSQTHIQLSLKTADLKTARVKASVLRATTEADFEKHRKLLAAQKSDTDILSKFSDHELLSLVSRWMIETRQVIETSRIKSISEIMANEDKLSHELELKVDEWQARQEMLGISDSERHEGMTTAVQFLTDEGISFKKGTERYQRLAFLFSKAIHDLARDLLAEWQGKQVGSVGFLPNLGAQKTKTIKEGFEEFLTDPSRKFSQSTKDSYNFVYRAISEIIGEELPLNQVTRDQCKDIRQLFLKLPKNMTKVLGNVTLSEAVKIAQVKGLPLMAAPTVNTYLQKLSAFMQFAKKEKYLFENPAETLAVHDSVKKKDKRNPFSDKQLQLIFNAPLYTGCVDDKNGYNKPGNAYPKKTRFWVPLIGLFTGMRLNEICQLEVADVEEKSGVLLLHCTELSDDQASSKSLKTETSVRSIPVHPELIKIGFITYINEIKSTGHTRLFPDLTQDVRGYWSHEISKWFSRFLKNTGAKTERTSFHSFRHTFRDALREAELPHETAMQLFAYGEKCLHGRGDLFLIYPKNEAFNSPLPPFSYGEQNLWIVPFDLETDELIEGAWSSNGHYLQSCGGMV